MKIITENGKKFKVSDDGKAKSFYIEKEKPKPEKIKLDNISVKEYRAIVLKRLGFEVE